MVLRSSHQDYFQIYLFFFSRSTFSGYFQGALCVHRTDTNFSERYLFVAEQILFFPGRCVCSSVYLVTKQIPIFQEHFLATEQILIFQKHIFSYRTDTDYLGSLVEISSNRQATSRKVPSSEQIFQQQVSVASFECYSVNGIFFQEHVSRFSRRLYLFVEQISLFPRNQHIIPNFQEKFFFEFEQIFHR